MIILITNRQDYTADFLIIELQRRGVEFIRFNTEDYPQNVKIFWELDGRSIGGYFIFPKRKVFFNEIKSVWYRRPVPPVPSSKLSNLADRDFAVAESQETLDGVLRCLDCFWVSHPDFLKRAEYKLIQLRLASKIGFNIWPTITTNLPDEAKSFFDKQNENIIYKPIQRGRIYRDENVSIIFSNPVSKEHIDKIETLEFAPALLQKYIEKEVEIRATVIGEKVFAVEIHSQENEDAKHDWRRGRTTQLHHQPHFLPPDITQKCINLVRSFKLAFGAIDLILTPNGEYVFLEINPNGQWAWIQQLIPEIPLRETLADLLISGSIDGK